MKQEEPIAKTDVTLESKDCAPQSQLLTTDFVSGFLLGVLTSLLSFYFLRFFKTKKSKRKGMLYGCLVSFVIIIFLCFSFTFYSYYVQRTLKINRKLMQHDQKVIKIDSFGHYIGARVLRITDDKVRYERPELEPKPEPTRNQRRRMALVKQRRRKIVR